MNFSNNTFVFYLLSPHQDSALRVSGPVGLGICFSPLGLISRSLKAAAIVADVAALP
jgi:hypothetical protein